jgi:hypothetical protein
MVSRDLTREDLDRVLTAVRPRALGGIRKGHRLAAFFLTGAVIFLCGEAS